MKRIIGCLFVILTMGGLAEDSDFDPYSMELMKKAEAGDASAIRNLAHCYSCGKHGVPIDDKEAVRWYTKAADQGDPYAQFNLGWYYAMGIVVTKDEKRAVDLFSEAAAKGSGLAEGSLGICYARGTGVSQDDKKAIDWFTKGAVKYFAKGAEKGDGNFRIALGLCYAHGIGVEKNEKKAIELIMSAAKQMLPIAFK